MKKREPAIWQWLAYTAWLTMPIWVKSMSDIQSLREQISLYMTPPERDFINKAYDYASYAHQGQTRCSKEPFITHPVAVATMLAQLQFNSTIVATGLLHDTVEDTNVTIQDIRNRFGFDIAYLVETLTKSVGSKKNHSKQCLNRQHEMKIGYATLDDPRVGLVRLFDRLHNMQTLSWLSIYQQSCMSRETLQIYAPLAHFFGLLGVRDELIVLSLHHLIPYCTRPIIPFGTQNPTSSEFTTYCSRLRRQEYYRRQIQTIFDLEDANGFSLMFCHCNSSK